MHSYITEPSFMFKILLLNQTVSGLHSYCASLTSRPSKRFTTILPNIHPFIHTWTAQHSPIPSHMDCPTFTHSFTHGLPNIHPFLHTWTAQHSPIHSHMDTPTADSTMQGDRPPARREQLGWGARSVTPRHTHTARRRRGLN